MTWTGITAKDYDALKEAVGWEADAPTGGIFHVAAIDDEGATITDVWESEDALNAFLEQRLMPKVQELGIAGQPDVQVRTTHRVFAPGFGGKTL